MIHEEICTYEVCKLAKEKGFPLQKVIKQDGRAFFYELPQSHPDWANCDAWYLPTQSLLQRWLREEKGIIIDVVLDWSYNIDFEEIRYQYRIGSIDRMTIEGGNKTKGLVFDKRFPTYELALEDALKYALEKLV